MLEVVPLRGQSVILVAFLFLLGCQESHTMRTYKADGFSVMLPRGIDVAKKSPVEDFDVYEFRKDGVTFLNAYVGNQPKFPSEGFKGCKEEAGAFKGFPERTLRKQTTTTASREILIDISRNAAWPQFVHLWYVGLPLQTAKLADDIIGSIEITVEGKKPGNP